MRLLFASVLLSLPFTAMCADRITGLPFATRSEVYAPHAIAATSHPLTTQIALDVMKQGGSAVDAAIADYVRRDAPLDCAGSYRVEALGVALFERIAGEDFTAVIGLPLTQLVTLLARFGVSPLAG